MKQGFKSNIKILQKENRILRTDEEEVNTKLTETPTSTCDGQLKVPMFKNDVSVDNMVVEIAPNDLIPHNHNHNHNHKSGNVKASVASFTMRIFI